MPCLGTYLGVHFYCGVVETVEYKTSTVDETKLIF